ncbi:CpsB/CapC family capsule biosynthesis tyrosine phosphatase [Priestia megaterium]|uniref:CpsB/CapC family capsule biosynthesis tyrosine phosphatase n=1 Tax=Priestia megaterium TaxID=1404 RepID=UPI0020D261D7|nr:CpsB/CapC family capsule biosynthesis tyrosine phosphatase [Priestia megaterium]
MSLIGYFGTRIKRFSLDVIDLNLTHMFASDAHNTRTRDFHIKEVSEVVFMEYGEETLSLFSENANQVILRKPCYKNLPKRVIKKKISGDILKLN